MYTCMHDVQIKYVLCIATKFGHVFIANSNVLAAQF